MNFSSDAMADFEGLLEVNRKICKQQMAEKASPTLPTNCAVLPIISLSISDCLRWQNARPQTSDQENDFTTALKLLKEHAYEAVAIQSKPPAKPVVCTMPSRQ